MQAYPPRLRLRDAATRKGNLMAFIRAERKRAKARILIEGPSGSGKSYSAIRLAKGIGGKIAAIDTEHGSLSMYSDLGEFDVMELSAPFSPDRYCAAIREAEQAGYDVLIIDSITHEWSGEGGCLDIKDKLPGANDWAKWSKVTPMHQRFIETMLQSPLHIIATVRSKTEWTLDENKPKKIGTAPQQRDGMDFEFTMVFSVQAGNHVASVTKDRTAQFDGYLQVIDETTGKRIADWLGSGADAPTTMPTDSELRSQIKEVARGMQATAEQMAKHYAGFGKSKLSELDTDDLHALLDTLTEAERETREKQNDAADYEPGGEG